MLPEDSQPYLDVAIDVIGTQNVSAVRKLKAFLVALPTPKQIEQVLAAAILHFAEHDRAVFEWVVEHQAVLAPELDLLSFVKKQVLTRLSDRGWVRHRDFELDIQTRSLTNHRTNDELADYFSQPEWQLIEAVLAINPSPDPSP